MSNVPPPAPSVQGYVPNTAQGEIEGTPPAPVPSVAPGGTPNAPAPAGDGFEGTNGAARRPTAAGSPLAPPAPARLQDIAQSAGDGAFVGTVRGGASGLDWFLDLLLEIITFGVRDTRAFNTYTTADREGFVNQGRNLGARAYASGNGAQLDHFIVRNTAGQPEMSGTPPQVRLQPELRTAIESEVRQAFTSGTPPTLSISEQALRIRVDSMMRGLREEMTAHLSGGTTVGPAGADARPAGPVTFERTHATPIARTLENGPNGTYRLTTFTSAADLTAFIEGGTQRTRARGDGATLDLVRGGMGGATADQIGAARDAYETASGWPLPDGATQAQRDSHDRISAMVARIPTAAQVRTIRQDFADMNAAIQRGDFAAADTIAQRLGLPISEEAMLRANGADMTDTQYQTVIALGMYAVPGRIIENRDGSRNFETGTTGWRDALGSENRRGQFAFWIPSGMTQSLNGPPAYAALMNDMERAGVTSLSAPPTEANIAEYLTHVQQENAHRSPADQQTALLAANQRLMRGLQVHYGAASHQNPDYGAHDAQTTGLFATFRGHVVLHNGQPLHFPLPTSMSDADKRTVLGLAADATIPTTARGQFDAWSGSLASRRDVTVEIEGRRHRVTEVRVLANSNLTRYTAGDHSPDSFTDVTDKRVYGQQWESDCEGMAAFRLRTLPPGFSPVGVVTGGPENGGVGHVVALFSGPDGKIYLSSNGGDPVEVTTTNANGRPDSYDIRRAVLLEFARIYHRGGGQDGALPDTDDLDRLESSFRWGIGTPGTPPAGSRTEQLGWQASQMLRDAGQAEVLRAHTQGMPALEWDALVPPAPAVAPRT